MTKEFTRATPYLLASVALLSWGFPAYGLGVSAGGTAGTGVSTPGVGVGSSTNVGVSTPTVGASSTSNVDSSTTGTTGSTSSANGVRVMHGGSTSNDATVNGGINSSVSGAGSVSNRGSADAIDCPPSNSRSANSSTDCMNSGNHANADVGIGTGIHPALGGTNSLNAYTNSGVHVGGTTGITVGR